MRPLDSTLQCTLLIQLNSQLLDLLLDINDSAQIPAHQRIDLSTNTPSLAAVPDLITPEELARASEFNTPAGQAIYNEITSIIAEKIVEKAASKPPKSLAKLINTTGHLSTSNPILPSDLLTSLEPPQGYTDPISYLTPDQIDEYLSDIDASIARATPALPPIPQSLHHEALLGNPHSVYNWLRVHEPKIFTADSDFSEKLNGKATSSLRGAGKRMSMPAPSKLDALEIVEEDGMSYDPTVGGLEPTKGKRKREDDGGYHPKLGAPSDGRAKRPRPKKKKVEGDSTGPPPRKRAKPRNSGDNMVIDTPGSVHSAA